ncbi:MAG: M15 family peptidase [Clostridia bacterium]|jgi:hypothetical protein
MSELGDKRKKFTIYVADLINFMLSKGYQPMLGKDGLKHMKGSLHYEGLAVDIDLTKDGVYLTNTDDHKQFGEYWESLDPLCAWGGRFKDGNHYSVTYMGKK